MKITKNQLRRIIKEQISTSAAAGNVKTSASVGGVDKEISDYLDFVEAEGHITPAASSVIASYFISIGSWSAPAMRRLGDHYGISVQDIQREVNIQRKEMAAGGLSQEVPELTGGRRSSWQVRKEKELGESVNITKRQLKRIIKESMEVDTIYLDDRTSDYFGMDYDNRGQAWTIYPEDFDRLRGMSQYDVKHQAIFDKYADRTSVDAVGVGYGWWELT